MTACSSHNYHFVIEIPVLIPFEGETVPGSTESNNLAGTSLTVRNNLCMKMKSTSNKET